MTENNNIGRTTFEDENVSMEDILKESGVPQHLDSGKEIEVTVVGETSEGFIVDLGMKSEGIILKSEYQDEIIPSELTVGAKISAELIGFHGQPVLSCKKVFERKKWQDIQTVFENNSHINGTILKTVKGGFIVDIGINAFLPISQLDVYFIKETDKYVGKTYVFAIAEFDRKKHNVVLSRRKILEEEKSAKKTAAIESLSVGKIVDGTVSNITKFGVFVNIGGVDGLLHISDMAWYKVKSAQDLVKVGQSVRVQITKIDKENKKIYLNMKSLTPNPWDCVEERFPVSLVMKGTVKSIADYGAFVELEPGVEGLLHASEYSWTDDKAFKKELKKDQEIEVKIISADKETKKISLSVKAMLPNPWEDSLKTCSPGTIVKGIVQNLTPFGAFVKLPQGVEGLIHISDFSWTKKIRHPQDMLKEGDEIEVMIREVNPQNQKISLSLKHIQDDPYKKYKVGNVIEGKIVRVVEFGAFIELEPGIEALIRNSEATSIKTEKERSFKEGETVEAKIINFNAKNRKIEVSIRKLEFDSEKELVKKYSVDSENPTLGDILVEY
ncbi:MAG: 30S ribosomal protein S1 [Elusimicrobiota bacterium]|jgi:small subunit ribosomal protein S1|nr:30S ribosomal protein S1 [Elusimicrobiota bacterium]